MAVTQEQNVLLSGLLEGYSPCKSWNGSQCLQKAARKYFWKRGL